MNNSSIDRSRTQLPGTEAFELTALRTLNSSRQWRTQEFCSGVGGGGSKNSVEDRGNGDLGALAP